MNALGHVFTVEVKRLKIEIHWEEKKNKQKNPHEGLEMLRTTR